MLEYHIDAFRKHCAKRAWRDARLQCRSMTHFQTTERTPRDNARLATFKYLFALYLKG